MKSLIKFRNIIRVVALSSLTVAALTLGAGAAKAAVNFSGGNGTTGPNSDNQNNWTIDHTVSVDINNESTATNTRTFSVDTGDTNIGSNTSIGGLATGNVFGTIGVNNNLNSGDIQLMNADPGNISFDVTNNTTGPNSLNENNLSLDINHNVDINNTANIDNTVTLSADTGNNNISNNTEVGNVRTGDINFSTNSNNTANGSMGSVNLSGMDGLSAFGHLTNTLTGPQSTNQNNVTVDSNSEINVNNTASINNIATVDANTGNNNVSNNTVAGNISTGSVNINMTSTSNAN